MAHEATALSWTDLKSKLSKGDLDLYEEVASDEYYEVYLKSHFYENDKVTLKSDKELGRYINGDLKTHLGGKLLFYDIDRGTDTITFYSDSEKKQHIAQFDSTNFSLLDSQNSFLTEPILNLEAYKRGESKITKITGSMKTDYDTNIVAHLEGEVFEKDDTLRLREENKYYSTKIRLIDSYTMEPVDFSKTYTQLTADEIKARAAENHKKYEGEYYKKLNAELQKTTTHEEREKIRRRIESEHQELKSDTLEYARTKLEPDDNGNLLKLVINNYGHSHFIGVVIKKDPTTRRVFCIVADSMGGNKIPENLKTSLLKAFPNAEFAYVKDPIQTGDLKQIKPECKKLSSNKCGGFSFASVQAISKLSLDKIKSLFNNQKPQPKQPEKAEQEQEPKKSSNSTNTVSSNSTDTMHDQKPENESKSPKTNPNDEFFKTMAEKMPKTEEGVVLLTENVVPFIALSNELGGVETKAKPKAFVTRKEDKPTVVTLYEKDSKPDDEESKIVKQLVVAKSPEERIELAKKNSFDCIISSQVEVKQDAAKAPTIKIAHEIFIEEGKYAYLDFENNRIYFDAKGEVKGLYKIENGELKNENLVVEGNHTPHQLKPILEKASKEIDITINGVHAVKGLSLTPPQQTTFTG